VQHLAASLAKLRVRRALPAGGRLKSAAVALRAHEMRMPAQNRSGRRRPTFPGPHAPHRTDQDEGASWSVGEDERFRSPRIENSRSSRLLIALRVQIVHRLVSAPAADRASVVPCAADGVQVAPVALLCGGHKTSQDPSRPRALRRRRDVDGRVLLEVGDQPVAGSRRQRLRSSRKVTQRERGSRLRRPTGRGERLRPARRICRGGALQGRHEARTDYDERDRAEAPTPYAADVTPVPGTVHSSRRYAFGSEVARLGSPRREAGSS
jgi:hypothetical protein